jgi:LPPG:FO 2-phospho-L-lactate transferase
LLSGGVGGARLARGLAARDSLDVTVIVNVADDERIYSLYVSPDLDTVTYTLAGLEGPDGWGIAGDRFETMERLALFGMDTTFRMGDVDLATNLYRTAMLDNGLPLSLITERIGKTLGVAATVLPATDDPVRTIVLLRDGSWRSFQEYFVYRKHQDEVIDLRFEGAENAEPAPGVLGALLDADVVVIGPSNPPLSIWPILAIGGISDAVASADRVIAVSPLFGGKALKGPADRVLASLGHPPGNAGVLDAYDGLVTDLVVDEGDAADRSRLSGRGVRIHVADTRIADPADADRFSAWLEELL